MATSHQSEASHGESPDPSSHAANVYDASGAGSEWLDEMEDDDDILSENTEFFDPSEDVEAEFHGTAISNSYR